MDNVRPHFIAVLVDVVHIELLGQQSIPLDGDHGVVLAVYVARIDVHLGAVEGSLAYILHEGNLKLGEHAADAVLGLVPDGGIANVFCGVVRIPLG